MRGVELARELGLTCGAVSRLIERGKDLSRDIVAPK